MRGCGPQWASVSKGQHHQSAVDEDTQLVHDKLWTAVEACHNAKQLVCYCVELYEC